MIDPLSVLSVVAGLIYLVMGGDLLIRGSISTARRFNVPPAVVGATLVALGTSLPELIVSLLAATTDHAGLALGNVVGWACRRCLSLSQAHERRKCISSSCCSPRSFSS